MDIKHQSLVLDINETRNYTFIKACQGDQKSRYIDCTLTQKGSVLRLTSNYRAIVKASINNEVKAINSCTIDTTSQVIVVELTSIMLDTPGILNCEITVQDGQQIVTSQAFAVQVRQSTVANETEIKKSKEYGALVDALNTIADVESKADKVQGLVDDIDKLESADRLKHLAEHGRFNFSATFTSDGVIKKTTSASILQSGDFATGQNDIGTAYVSNAVTKIGSGTFSNCTSLKTIYIDNTVGNVDIVSGAVPDGVSIVYSNDDNFINVNELLASAIKSLKKQVNADKSDWENRATSIETQHKTDVQTLNANISQVADNLQIVKEAAQREIATTNTNVNGKESLSNKVDVITHPSTNTYPSVKGVWDFVETKSEQPRADIAQNKADIVVLKVDKVDNTDFSTYKSTNDTAVKKNATDIAQLNADVLDNAIKVTTDKSTSVAITDSSDKNILKLVCDSEDYQVKLYKKNLFDFRSCNVFTNDGAKTTLIDRTNNIVKFTTNENVNTSGIYFRHTTLKGYEVDYTKLLNKTVTLSFDIVSNIDCQMRFSFITNNWSNYTSITTSKQRIIITELVNISKLNNAMTFYCNKSNAEITISNIQIEVNNVATDYEKCEFQSVDKSTDMTTVHSYYPTTTVIADSDFQLTYIADTKNYIDNKLNEIATALVAHESEVM